MPPSAGPILAGYRLLGWMFPARDLSELTTETYEELCQKYKRRDSLGNWIGCLFYTLMVMVYFLGMLLIGRWMVSDIPQEHYVGPLEFLYFFGAGFLSLVSSGYFLFAIYRLALGKHEYDLYMAYGGEKIRRSAIGVPIHFGKAFAMFFWVLTPPLALLMFAYMDAYTSFTEQTMILNPFWSLGQRMTRPYGDVRDVYEVRKVHRRDKDELEPFQVIVFHDGTQWETDHGSLDPKLQMQRDLMQLVAKKSGKQVKKVEFIEDILAK